MINCGFWFFNLNTQSDCGFDSHLMCIFPKAILCCIAAVSTVIYIICSCGDLILIYTICTNSFELLQLPHDTKFWKRKTLSNLGKQTSFTNILPSQIDSLKVSNVNYCKFANIFFAKT